MEPIIGAENAPPADLIKDATVETFEEDVIRASMEAPVIVDFWADWCGPCKQLAPLLERAVVGAGGKVRLVKVDIDKNQMLASQLRIQSIPTVYAFFQGRPIDGFQGALPESEIKTFINRLVEAAGGAGAEDPTEDYLNAGEAALKEGDVAAAAGLFGQVAQAAPDNLRAIAGLARCQLAAGDVEKARQTLALAPDDKKDDPALSGIEAAIALAEEGGGGDVSALRDAVEANPADLPGRFEYAGALIGVGAMDEAIDQLLLIVEKDREWNDEAARKKLLTVFEALGPAHAATLRGRRRLSSILFS